MIASNSSSGKTCLSIRPVVPTTTTTSPTSSFTQGKEHLKMQSTEQVKPLVVKTSGVKAKQHPNSAPSRISTSKTSSSNEEEEMIEAVEWKVAVDPRTGRSYYYNPVTRETSWTKPATAKPRPKSSTSTGGSTKENFFQIMEKNIRSKLRQGQLSCDVSSASCVEPQQKKNTENSSCPVSSKKTTKQHPTSSSDYHPFGYELTAKANENKVLNSMAPPRIIRTLSSVDDLALQDYKKAAIPKTCSETTQPHSIAISNAPTNGSKSNVIAKQKITPVSKLKRSNSTSTIYVRGGTMSAPDQDATIQCVCTVLRAHMLEAVVDGINQHVDPRFEAFVSPDIPVMSEEVPSLTELTTFMRNVHMKAQLEAECIIMTLIYVERLLKATNGNLQFLPCNWPSILFCSMVMASKVWDDLSMWNADFSKICPLFTLQRVNELELAYLDAVEYSVRVSAASYAKYYFHLRAMCASLGIRGSKLIDMSPLDLEGARTMQFLSEEYEERSKLMPVPRRRSTTITSGVSPKKLEQLHESGYRFSDNHRPCASIEQLVHSKMKNAGQEEISSSRSC